ncbi:hypothetical protein C8R48DRAFT_678617 [Suillus tomentosus]|nr:hypothetical protein C8R48DRAFT_678617 [Suillus tomentosus]
MDSTSNEAKPGTDLVSLSLDGPYLILREGTKFKTEFVPKMSISEARECIGMFPEGKPTPHYFIAVFHCIVGILGGSHDMTDILPLKPGVSIIAVGTMVNDPSVQVKISLELLSNVPTELVEMFTEGGNKKHGAVANLPKSSAGYTRHQGNLLGQVVKLNRRFSEGYTHFKVESWVRKLRTDVLKYNQLICDLGIPNCARTYDLYKVPRAQMLPSKLSANSTEAQHKLFKGQPASNFLQRLWGSEQSGWCPEYTPERAASNPINVTKALLRLHEFRYRVEQRGVRAIPLQPN